MKCFRQMTLWCGGEWLLSVGLVMARDVIAAREPIAE